jgi:hypothetical protein
MKPRKPDLFPKIRIQFGADIGTDDLKKVTGGGSRPAPTAPVARPTSKGPTDQSSRFRPRDES